MVKLLISFPTCLILTLSDKMVNHYQGHVIFQDTEH